MIISQVIDLKPKLYISIISYKITLQQTTLPMRPQPQTQQKPQQKPKPKWINPLRDRTRVIPFIVPNQQQRMNALGSLAGQKWRIKKSLQAIIKDFDPIKKPQPGDNLYQFQQQGQSFPLFASIYRNHLDKTQQIIYLATFHCKLSKQILLQFKKYTKSFFYGVKIKLHKFQDDKVDLNKFNPLKSGQGDTYYDAALMNVHFMKCLPKKCYSIAIVTDLLLYNGDNPAGVLEETWIFGLGSIKDRTSISSYAQICKKGYQNKLIPQQYQSNYQNDFNLLFMKKVINHQLCHTFAMKHCIFYTCLMNGSNGYIEASSKPQHLCPICLRKLQHAVQFDIVERYEKIGENGDQKSLELVEKIREALGQNK